MIESRETFDSEVIRLPGLLMINCVRHGFAFVQDGNLLGAGNISYNLDTPSWTHKLMPEPKLKVFLCHSTNDKPTVRELFCQLTAEGWIDVWLDEQKILPGQEWDVEIEKAVNQADVVVACLSAHSVDKEGYVQKELRFVLNIADEEPEGTIFVVPLRFDDCQVPRRLRAWQWVDYFPKDHRVWAYQRLLESLKLRAADLGISTVKPIGEKAGRETEERVHREAQAEIKSQLEKIVEQPVQRKAISSPPLEQSYASDKRTKSILFGIGMAGLLVLVFGIFGVNYIIQNFFVNGTPTPTNYPLISVSTSAPTRIVPTNTIVQPVLTDIPTLGIGSTMISQEDGMVMVYVPAGEFSMGSANGEIDEKPVHTVYLDAFWIDRTEVTNGMYAKCVQTGRCGPPMWSSSFTRENYYGDPEFDDYPVNNINWYNADLYCDWANRHLPTEAEWEKAAGWDETKNYLYIYPWGNSINCSLANYSDENGSCVGDTVKVGSYLNGKSPYGALDMAGNVIEWIYDWYDENYYSISPSTNPLGPDSGQYRVFRGGAWDHAWNGVRVSWRTPWDPSKNGYNIGFRCVYQE